MNGKKDFEVNGKLLAAVKFVFKIYHTQQRKTLPLPAWLHLLNVWRILAEYGQSEDLQMAGLLNDILEDFPITAKELKRNFSERVVQLVEMVSEDEKTQKIDPSFLSKSEFKQLKYFRKETERVAILERKTGWWLVRKDRFLQKIFNNQDNEAIKLLLADKTDNLQSIRRQQFWRNELCWKQFNAGYEFQKKYFQKLERIIGQKVKQFSPDLVLKKMFIEFQLVLRQVFGKN